MNTYSSGYSLLPNKDITKNDLVNLCSFLNEKYENDPSGCYFEPEPICEGGIIFRFPNNTKWYKSFRIYFSHKGVWPWIKKDDVIKDWTGNGEILLKKGIKIGTFLKSFHGAPSFTIDELKIWEECFGQIGFTRKGRYPAKRDLLPQN